MKKHLDRPPTLKCYGMSSQLYSGVYALFTLGSPFIKSKSWKSQKIISRFAECLSLEFLKIL